MPYYNEGPMTEKKLADLIASWGQQDSPMTDGMLSNLVSMPQQQQALPANYVRTGSTGAVQDLGPSMPYGGTAGNPDYAQPIEIGGVGKGYRLKGDPNRVVLSDGRIANIGLPTGTAERNRRMALEQAKIKSPQDLEAEEYARLRGRLRAETEFGGPVDKTRGTIPAGYRMTPDGNMEPIPGGPADQKALAAAGNQAAGAAGVNSALTSLRDAYNRLDEGEGITSTERGTLSNLAAGVGSSAPGQMVGKLLGTKNQSARNDIAMSRPVLLAALMKATGMSAKQMDSNAELKLWLSTATDPTLDVESNRRALDAIEAKYLSGSPAASTAPKPTSSIDYQQTLFNAKKAIAKNPAAREAILQKMQAAGYDTRGL